MAYFNHAFNKVFFGDEGFVSTAATTTPQLLKGEFTFVDPRTWAVPANLDGTFTDSCPLVLVSGAIYQNDKIGPFHGGYQETNKSKVINPKYISRFYRVDPCLPQQHTISVGVTPFTVLENTPNCQKDFICGETYNLRLDIKGSPVLRYLSRNTYFTAAAYTGCCDPNAIAPGPVDPTTVYIEWAKQLLNSVLINPFIQIEIFDTTGASLGVMTKDNVNDPALGWNTYVPVAGAAGLDAGMYITGAYVDTQFGNCTFYPNDSIIALLEPVKIYASEVDLTGDPCVFTGVCVADTCCPIQGAGFGENVVRELILSERYNQSPFYTGTDLRIREITQGYDVTNTIDRTGVYTRYFIQHNVPRLNNPTGVFDNDQYLLEIVQKSVVVVATGNQGGAATFTVPVSSTAGIEVGMQVAISGTLVSAAVVTAVDELNSEIDFDAASGIVDGDVLIFMDGSAHTFETFMNTWLDNCCASACVQLEIEACNSGCTPPRPVETPPIG